MLSVVIPTLNAAAGLPATLACVRDGAASIEEIIVSDGGSSDATIPLAETAGCRIVVGPRGRGAQLAAGAASASGRWLLFLHADTRLAPGWPAAVRAFCDGAANASRAGYFRLALDDTAAAARRLERLVAWRCRWLALPYGDQGLLIRAETYRAVGGFAPLPLMEDVDLVRRLGRARLVELPATALTSAARYRRDGYWLRPVRNLACLGLYFAGLPPHRLARLYG
ncbi:MAG TPA: TIGR04283 family arsenosugar biosynthesis glycosyltransferase [Alphaproteobacteria bacterium]